MAGLQPGDCALLKLGTELPLRQDELSVIERMQGGPGRRVSLPSRLAGIAEREVVEPVTVQCSLDQSYREMKCKLDELESYNSSLESQLQNIFHNISSSVERASRPGDPPPPPRPAPRVRRPVPVAPRPAPRPAPPAPPPREEEEPGKGDGVGVCSNLSSIISELRVTDISRLQQAVRQRRASTSACPAPRPPSHAPSTVSPAPNIVSPAPSPAPAPDRNNNRRTGAHSTRSKSTGSPPELGAGGELARWREGGGGQAWGRGSGGGQARVLPALHNISETGEIPIRPARPARVIENPLYQDSDQELTQSELERVAGRGAGRGYFGGVVRSSPPRHCFSSAESFSEISLWGGSGCSSSAADSEHETETEQSVVSSETVSSIQSDADCVDEFFLFPYEVLDADFDTVCLDLARFSADMEQLLARQSQDETASSFLKAAKASDQLKTLWIYRGV